MKQRCYRLLVVIGLIGCAGSSQAAMNLVTDFPIGTPLVMDAGGVSVDKMLVSIHSAANDLILGWQTSLRIVSTGGVGTLGFHSTAQPLAYVFGSRSAFYSEDLSFPVNNDGMFAFDFTGVGGLLPPVPVPSPPGLNLNALDFVASTDASGTFGVFAVGGAGRSEWTDDTFGERLFTNIDPALDSLTQIGEILVRPSVIPEPGTLAVWSLLVGIGAFANFHRVLPRRAVS